MNWRILLPLGVAALLFGLVSYAPAAWLAEQVHARAPMVRLAGVSGTALSGRAQFALVDGALLRDVAWQLRPASLLRGRFAANLDVATDTGSIRARAERSFDGKLYITDAEGTATLAWFGRLAGYPQLPLTGDVRANVSEAVLGDTSIPERAAGRLQLANIRWQLAQPPIQIGSVNATLTTDEQQALVLRVEESDGPLAVTGDVQANGQSYRLDLGLRARAGADERLKSMLEMLGRPDAEGTYRIRENGRL